MERDSGQVKKKVNVLVPGGSTTRRMERDSGQVKKKVNVLVPGVSTNTQNGEGQRPSKEESQRLGAWCQHPDAEWRELAAK